MSAGQYDHARALQRRLSTTRPSACTENWRRQFRRLCAKTTSDHRTPLVRSVTAWATSALCAAALPAWRGAVISALSESITKSPPSYSDPSTKFTEMDASQPSQWKGKRGLEVVEYLRTNALTAANFAGASVAHSPRTEQLLKRSFR